MTTTTANLGLFKYQSGTDNAKAFNIETALNQNWDKLDTFVNEIRSLDGLTEEGEDKIKAIGNTLITKLEGTVSLEQNGYLIFNKFLNGAGPLYAWKYSNSILYTSNTQPKAGDYVYNSLNQVQYTITSVASDYSYIKIKYLLLEYTYNRYATSDIDSIPFIIQYGYLSSVSSGTKTRTVTMPTSYRNLYYVPIAIKSASSPNDAGFGVTRESTTQFKVHSSTNSTGGWFWVALGC